MVDHRIVHVNCVFPCFYYFLTISNKVFFFDLGKKNRENKKKIIKFFLISVFLVFTLLKGGLSSVADYKKDVGFSSDTT